MQNLFNRASMYVIFETSWSDTRTINNDDNNHSF